MTIRSVDARALVDVCLAKGEAADERLSVAVVDPGGYLVAFGRTDDAGPYSTEVAIAKAYSVTFMGRDTAQLRDLADRRPQFFGALAALGRHGLIPSPGGIPIDGGAIGVSGGSSPELDLQIALDAIAELERGGASQQEEEGEQ